MKSQGAKQPTAYGSLLQSSSYGSAIPTVYGQTQSPLLAIWAANLRQGNSSKKFKAKLKGIVSYVENVDFLLGHNPIMAVLQIWNNGSLLPLKFVQNTGPSNTGSGNSGITVPVLVPDPVGGWYPDPYFYCVVAVTLPLDFSYTFNDYGAPNGPFTVAGRWEIPFWNDLETGPDPTHPLRNLYFPFCYSWEPSYGPFIVLDSQVAYGANLNIYYAQIDRDWIALRSQAPH